MYIIKLAFRNIFRQKTRSIIVIIGLAVSVGMLIILDSMMSGINLETEKNIVNYETGSFVIYSKSYYDKKDEKPYYEMIENPEKIINILNSNGFNASGRTIFTGTLISLENELPFLFYGIDVNNEKKILNYHSYINNGKNIESGRFEILLGSEGAKKLGVKIGDTVKLYTIIQKKDENGKIKNINQVFDLKISGTIHSPNPRNNQTTGYIPIDVLQTEEGLMLQGGINQIIVRKKGVKVDTIPGKDEKKEKIETILKKNLSNEEYEKIKVLTYLEEASDYVTLARSKSGGSKIMVFILFILSFLGVSNIMLMATLEREKEVGMMRANGFFEKDIFKLFIVEAGLLGAIGAFLGIIYGTLVNFYMVNIGIDFGEIINKLNIGNMGYRVTGTLKSVWDIKSIISSTISAIIISMVVTIPATRRLLKKSIVENINE